MTTDRGRLDMTRLTRADALAIQETVAAGPAVGRCRCRHSRYWHQRRSGKLRLPCQYGRTAGSAMLAQRCVCRDYHPAEAPR